MKTIERAKEFYGNAPDGYPEWDDLTELGQINQMVQYVEEGKITECEMLLNVLDDGTQVWCDEEADPETGYCDDHWDDITRNWRY